MNSQHKYKAYKHIYKYVYNKIITNYEENCEIIYILLLVT